MMPLDTKWCDDFVRLDPVKRRVLDGDEAWDPPIRLSSGRNMFASFQLSVGPIKKSSTVTVKAAALKGPRGTSISPSQFDIYVQWYHNLNDKWWPEICVPQRITGGSTPDFRKKNMIPEDGYAGFWVDLFVPDNTRPGEYQGEVKVKVGNNTMAVPVQLTVLKGRIGPDTCIDVSANNYADGISKGWPELWNDPDHLKTAMYQRCEKGVFRTAHDHRMFLHYLPYGHSGNVRATFAPPLEGEGPNRHVKSWAMFDRRFGSYLDGSAFKGTRRGAVPVKRFYTPLNLCWPSDFVKFGQPGYEAEWRAVGKDMVDHFREKGWTKTSFDMFLNQKQRFRFFPWDVEEVRFPEDNDVHRYFAKLWQGTFDRKSTGKVRFDYTLGTTWLFEDDIRSDLTDFIDVFIGGGHDMARSHDLLPQLKKKNRQLWGCLHSGNIVRSTRAAAYPPLMIWMTGTHGYMPRWCTMGSWGSEAWGSNISEGGAATFMYCGSHLGTEETFASVRMKVQRNSIQMIDSFDAGASRLKSGKPAVKRRINRILGIGNQDWFPSRAFDPDDTDRFTEEPPLAGWEKFSTEQNRKLRQLAIEVVSGGK